MMQAFLMGITWETQQHIQAQAGGLSQAAMEVDLPEAESSEWDEVNPNAEDLGSLELLAIVDYHFPTVDLYGDGLGSNAPPSFRIKFQGSAGKGMRMHRNAPWSSLLILDGLTRIMLCGRRCQSLCWRLWLIFPARPAASHGWFCGMKLLRALEWSYLEGPESCQEIIMGYLVNSFVSGLFLCDLRRCGG